MGKRSTRSCCSRCSGHSGYHIRGSPPQRLLCDGLSLVLCIVPCRNPHSLCCGRYVRAPRPSTLYVPN